MVCGKAGPEAFMVETIMYFGIGFLCASLFGLVLIPLVHNRAVRLTMRLLEAATPLSMAEIQADKDQLRATEQEYTVKTTSMRETELALAEKAAALTKLTSELGERSAMTESQKVEIVALRTQVDALKNQLDRFEKDVKDTEDRLTRERGDADAATKELSDERGKVENLGNRVAQLERQLVAQTTEAEIFNRRVQDLEGRLTEQGRLLVEREYAANQMREQLDAAGKTETDLRAELASMDGRSRESVDAIKAENIRLETELGQVRDERSRLQQEIASMKRDAEASWASERVESALLRERINDIAAEVARLTMTLEGPNSPIEAILAAEATQPKSTNGSKEGEHAQGNLADRIRALQSKASRTSTAS